MSLKRPMRSSFRFCSVILKWLNSNLSLFLGSPPSHQKMSFYEEICFIRRKINVTIQIKWILTPPMSFWELFNKYNEYIIFVKPFLRELWKTIFYSLITQIKKRFHRFFFIYQYISNLCNQFLIDVIRDFWTFSEISCSMCGNPRKFFGKVTRKEILFL